MEKEKRLIDANALEAAITVDYYEHFTQCHTTDQIALIDMVCEDIGNAPTVDAVEVVRCHECRSWIRNIENRKEYGTCYCRGFSRGIPKHENGYCDCGKRRDDHGQG